MGASEMFSIDLPIRSSVRISLLVVNTTIAAPQARNFLDIYAALQDFPMAKSLRIEG